MADVEHISILGADSIRIGFHLADYIAKTVTEGLPSSNYVLITDTSLAPLYLGPLKRAFVEQSPSGSQINGTRSPEPVHHPGASTVCALGTDKRFLTYVIPPGEVSKSRQTKADIEDFLLSQRCTRDTVILALGGGVVGDLVGFVAATFMRGLRFCQIPTSLLAMVDSSVGGKTAIDTPLGKNLVGAFHQPSYIFIDLAYLETLPTREFANGMAEVVKTAAIWSADEFESLESGVEQVIAAAQSSSQASQRGRTASTRSIQQQRLLSIVKGSIAVKSHIVTVDEKETGLRNLVNFGHTIGHAIEAVMTPDILHGECVSVGMILEAEVARALGHLGNADIGRLKRCLAAYGLPTTLSDALIVGCAKSADLNTARLLDVMSVDKKNAGKGKKVVLLTTLGRCLEERATVVSDSVISRVLASSVLVSPLALERCKQHVTLTTPGSKSISNRALLLAGLAEGTCEIKNLLHSDDTQVMMTALVQLGGASFTWRDGGETLVVTGNGGSLHPPADGKEIYLGNAGTAARFVTTVCTLAQGNLRSTITGNTRMKQRPIGPLVEALRSNGSDITYQESEGCLPLQIGTNGLRGGHIALSASISSQYVSSILLSAPYAAQPVTLELIGGTVISQPYIDMTIAMMSDFGIVVERLLDSVTRMPTNTYRIPQGRYTAPVSYVVESDASSATYPLAVAAITGTTCTVQGIGATSLQGDARFARDVLEPMGCNVKQTDQSTTVTGPPPGRLRALPQIDMEPMTDAFLTAAVLAAVAVLPSDRGQVESGQPNNSTRIHGIANQRVKECDRIAAMREQLAKFGVECQELSDGIEVFGVSLSELKAGARVHCYDDHRVAMAFSVLASLPGGRGAIIDERRCVEKTWPGWWDDLTSKLGVQVSGYECAPVQSSSFGPTHPPDATILLTGMRGAGKSRLGRLAALMLSRKFIDADHFFEAKRATTVKTFVAEHGWDSFRTAELQDLQELCESHAMGHVIALGGGIVETAEGRRALRTYAASKGPVVQVSRGIDEISAYLAADPTRPAYGESVEAVFARRSPWYNECSSWDYFSSPSITLRSKPNDVTIQSSDPEIERFFNFVTGNDSNHVHLKDRRSYFLSLTFPDVTPALAVIDTLTVGVDAIELRVDLLTGSQAPSKPFVPSTKYVSLQLAQLRRHTSLPIIFTVRTVSQGGFFPDDAQEAYFDLLTLAVRQACEYVDLEMQWPTGALSKFVRAKQSSLILASFHDWSGVHKWKSTAIDAAYARASLYGDVVKIVLKAQSMTDNSEMLSFRAAHASGKPLLTVNMGTVGQLSRILNPVLSPVTHPALPAAAAPGQLAVYQIQQALSLIGQISVKRFALLGQPISASKSPLLHNTGFAALGLPHTYGLLETAEVDESVRDFVRSSDFGGASVTIPHKTAIIALCDEVSEAVRIIGACNTLVPVQRGSQIILRGENTDFRGIVSIIAAEQLAITADSHALVIGAGGTARAAVYALHQAGFARILLYNRTIANAQVVARSLAPAIKVDIIDSLQSAGQPQAIVSTVPGSSSIEISSSLFRPGGGIAIDMAYTPRETALLKAAQTFPDWRAVPGIEVLLAQGYEQFRLWTGFTAPACLIAPTVLSAYDA
ncbi:uncharacterized protein L969DRAFT_100128 [Mixia osmundae IAM 14324]|uniref:Pentafunctional AROM polypeptide n=1 Tax=Mixia osmundae (strain CBS 9802 / IAM 14324 / JCM 22182 / KY 12970) TaxID=764103 RepID=G7E1H6_MIXOS|nr:uncharacterized protein L969DRAFT_100128 [Mixia osmundae IAM 14324]KEI36640.1 hypothetical protein L969DRAFT_100128 [Mixia osmundae IAM 14324]GAA96686.1 hypothetical protein E5Q_03357 [Mixia osmundae IAM 14324]